MLGWLAQPLSKYYDVQQAGQLTAAFSSIAQSLASLRIAK